MSKSIKLNNNQYWDSAGITHSRQKLSDLLTTLNNNISALQTSVSNLQTSVSKLTPTVLYNNDGASSQSSITLSDSAANYTRLVIFYKQTAYYTRTDKSVEISSPNNKTVVLDENLVLLTYNGSSYNGAYGMHRAFKISAKTITLLNACNQKYVGLNGTGTWGVADTIIITKVIGYKA